MQLFGKWKPRIAGQDEKGQASIFYIFLGVVIAFVAIIAFNYYHDRNTDFRIHVPRIEVH